MFFNFYAARLFNWVLSQTTIENHKEGDPKGKLPGLINSLFVALIFVMK